MQTLAKYKKICYHKQADFDNDKKRPHGQAVKTLPSHGRISGSIPLRAAKALKEISVLFLCNNTDRLICCFSPQSFYSDFHLLFAMYQGICYTLCVNVTERSLLRLWLITY